jgi:molybdate transport system ATP-binding protein
MSNQTPSFDGPAAVHMTSTFHARVLRHDPQCGLSTLQFSDGELRVPMTPAAVDSCVSVTIDARDVSIALSRPMDVSITNRLPGTIVELTALRLPFVAAVIDLGSTRLTALVTVESVERLALEPGLRSWAMIKAVAIDEVAVQPAHVPRPRRWSVVDNSD